MNKTELIQQAAEAANMSRRDVGMAFDALLLASMKALESGEKLQLMGFGVFEVKHHRRLARCTAQDISETPTDHKSVIFRAGKALKEMVNKQEQ